MQAGHAVRVIQVKVNQANVNLTFCRLNKTIMARKTLIFSTVVASLSPQLLISFANSLDQDKA